jgi:TRAP transporter TAXI family solute receptor
MAGLVPAIHAFAATTQRVRRHANRFHGNSLKQNAGTNMTLPRRTLLGLALAAPASRAFADEPWPGALVMGTGRPGGYYALYGPEWGKLATRATGVRIAYRASGGAAADILLIEQGVTQLGMTTVTVADQARAGSGQWTGGVQFDSFRALFPMFPSVLQIISPQGTGITKLADLAGHLIGTGPDGGTGAAAIPGIFSSLGIKPARLVAGDYDHQIQDMLAGRLSACAFLGAPPMPAIARAASHQKFSLIGFAADQIDQVANTQPGITSMVLAAGTFPGQSIAVASIGTTNLAIGAASLPDSLARALTMAALSNRAALAALVPAAAALPETAPILNGQITFHPGAADALRSLGLPVPAKYVEG